MSRYHLVTTWRFDATVEQVATVLADVERLIDWWPSVYLDVVELAPGDESGVGKEVELFTKGWLPYTLRWTFRVTEADGQHVVLTPTGDFMGRGEWTFVQDGPTAVVRYDWDVEARKPILRALSWLFRPVFTANHDWAMRQGEESLRLELARRRAVTPEERSRILPPPGPSFLTFGAARRRRPSHP
ncbi:hypothetical protein Rumeso_02721 [Rubellimicrobium mesophilum DSM 19309]|uniref:Ribosome association toxin RatA n=1 Tax=Rubellimicrobium mesophilum DSM 19309 TaxID=442562 RepID=A0A017HPF3_9RHOB|nr:SRPBCC family protein [Rubellimicrobium mesophilum]EYD75634.1 hypothetical protein Rumeso_02721 [Rubellimicrobium mesophilum DSM 19309]